MQRCVKGHTPPLSTNVPCASHRAKHIHKLGHHSYASVPTMVHVPIPAFAAVRKHLSTSFLKNHAVATKITDNLHYTYNSKELCLLDAYPGNMVFSAALHNTLQPNQHVILESRIKFNKLIGEYLDELKANPDTQSNSFQLIKQNPYHWKTFLDITDPQTGVVNPGFEARDHAHSKLMLTANLAEESLLMQWLACMGHQNWIQRFGSVRMLLWVPESSAIKIMATPGSSPRNKCSLVRETFSDARLLATTNSEKFQKKSPFDDDTLKAGNTLIVDPEDLTGGPMSLLEITPKDHQVEDVFSWDYVTKGMLILRTKTVTEAIDNIGPGAKEYFSTKIPKEMMSKRVKDLVADDFVLITNHFDLWPFKPDYSLDLVAEDIF